jgi:hypothetical protein
MFKEKSVIKPFSHSAAKAKPQISFLIDLSRNGDFLSHG